MTTPHHVPQPPDDLEAFIPELAGLGKRTTLLLTKDGDPTARESSVGGPLLWPAGEPWPYCDRPGHEAGWPHETPPAGPVPMVPVVQLFARDVPELRFPEGKDVLQIVWCALLHYEDPICAARPRIHWRSEAEVVAGGLLGEVPVPGEGEYCEDFMPRPRRMSPTSALEYPNWDMPREVRQKIQPRIEEIEARYGCYYVEWCALQTKVGGYPAWTQPPDWPSCERGHRMEHLLSVTGEEDMDMGDAGGMYFFVCRGCPGPELPYAFRYDCH